MINLSLTDLNRIQFREKFTGQLLVNVDKGRVVCNYHQMKQLSPQGNHYRKSQNVPE